MIWNNIKIAERFGCVKPIPAYAPSGKLYVVYEAGKQIHLSSYGAGVVYEKTISQSALLAHEPAMYITKNGFIHIVWVECSQYEDDLQYVKYCFYNGSIWSAVTTLRTLDIGGALPGGFVTRKVEDLRMAVDENNNVFIVLMTMPARACKFISKYGDNVSLEFWPMVGTSKHPDVAVDANNIHIAWQQMWDGRYTVAYCTRANIPNSAWLPPVDIRDGIHRPRIAVDPTGIPHVFYMADFEDIARNSIYKYWTGSGFSRPYIISDDRPRQYSNLSMAVFDKDNILTVDLMALAYFKLATNGIWSGHQLVENMQAQPDYTTCALSQDGKTAAVAYTSRGDSIYLNIGTSDAPPPPPPPALATAPLPR